MQDSISNSTLILFFLCFGFTFSIWMTAQVVQAGLNIHYTAQALDADPPIITFRLLG